MSKRIVIYPGTFDPLTYGHIDIIERAAQLGDELIIAVAENAGKKPLLNVEERVTLAKAESQSLIKEGRVTVPMQVKPFATLLTDFARPRRGISVLRFLVRRLLDHALASAVDAANALVSHRVPSAVVLLARDEVVT